MINPPGTGSAGRAPKDSPIVSPKKIQAIERNKYPAIDITAQIPSFANNIRITI